MTSNVGANLIERPGSIGFQISRDEETNNYRQMKDKVLEELKKTFRPEFLNRIDEVIVFHALTREQLKEIVEMMVKPVLKQLAERGINLELAPDVKDLLAKEGFDPTFGARPLRRSIQRLIENPLSEELLKGTITPNSNVRAEIIDDQISFRTIAQPNERNSEILR
jgi:ATP-dependent Clp protease ATP-binding subunit ClpC